MLKCLNVKFIAKAQYQISSVILYQIFNWVQSKFSIPGVVLVSASVSVTRQSSQKQIEFPGNKTISLHNIVFKQQLTDWYHFFCFLHRYYLRSRNSDEFFWPGFSTIQRSEHKSPSGSLLDLKWQSAPD